MPRKIRPIRVCGDVAYVPLTQGRTAIIDAADAALVGGRNWYLFARLDTAYARASDYSGAKQRTVLLHRVLMGEPEGLEVDHDDGDGLNNRRGNLRVATHSQNMRNSRISRRNTSGFKGVYFHKKAGKWASQIKFNGKKKYIGCFASPEEAHEAYCRASKELHGDFGRTS